MNIPIIVRHGDTLFPYHAQLVDRQNQPVNLTGIQRAAFFAQHIDSKVWVFDDAPVVPLDTANGILPFPAWPTDWRLGSYRWWWHITYVDGNGEQSFPATEDNKLVVIPGR